MILEVLFGIDMILFDLCLEKLFCAYIFYLGGAVPWPLKQATTSQASEEAPGAADGAGDPDHHARGGRVPGCRTGVPMGVR